MKFITKRIKIIIIFLLALIFIFFCFYQNNHISITTINLSSSKINDDITFIQISDLHGKSFGKNNTKLIKNIDKINPDFICVTGDMFTRNDDNGRQIAQNLLSNLAKKYQVFFVWGEHDGDKDFINTIKNNNVNVLSYDKKTISIKNTKIDLYGISTVDYSESYNLYNEFDKVNEKNYNILLAHVLNPTAFAAFLPDLVLSGDTHGGQIRFPFIGSFFYKNIWFPKFNYKQKIYDKGLYLEDDVNMYVSSGLGNYPYDIRLFNYPEIAVFKVTQGG